MGISRVGLVGWQFKYFPLGKALQKQTMIIKDQGRKEVFLNFEKKNLKLDVQQLAIKDVISKDQLSM